MPSLRACHARPAHICLQTELMASNVLVIVTHLRRWLRDRGMGHAGLLLVLLLVVAVVEGMLLVLPMAVCVVMMVVIVVAMVALAEGVDDDGGGGRNCVCHGRTKFILRTRSIKLCFRNRQHRAVEQEARKQAGVTERGKQERSQAGERASRECYSGKTCTDAAPSLGL